MAMLCKQVSAVTADEVGRLAELTAAVKAAGVNIQAVCAWVADGRGHLLMHTDDDQKACEAIHDSVDSCDFAEAVCVTTANTPGALNTIAGKLADAGIGINVVYATACEAPEAMVLLMTTDNAKAAQIL